MIKGTLHTYTSGSLFCANFSKTDKQSLLPFSETIAEDNNKPSSSHLQSEPEKALESIEDGSSALSPQSQNKEMDDLAKFCFH